MQEGAGNRSSNILCKTPQDLPPITRRLKFRFPVPCSSFLAHLHGRSESNLNDNQSPNLRFSLIHRTIARCTLKHDANFRLSTAC